MKRETLFLRLAVILIGIPVLALCVVGLPWLVNNPVKPDYTHILYPIIISVYLTVIPFYMALYQAFKLLNYIDRNQAFSELSVTALKKIKFSAIAISCVYVVIMPFIYLLADLDDSPGLIIVGLAVIFAPFVIAVFAAVLQKLLKNAIDIKTENDLTV